MPRDALADNPRATPARPMPPRSTSRPAPPAPPTAAADDDAIAAQRRPVTLHQVAEAAGVSLMTVSRALNTPERVSPDALARVKAAVARTGYIPNLLAGGLKSRRSQTVGVLVPLIAVAQFLPTIQTLTATLEAAGYQVILAQTGYDRTREPALVDTLLGRRIDALVVAGLLQDAQAIARLRAARLPVVETWDLTGRPVDQVVGFSHPQVGAAVAGHVLARGWEAVGVATGDDARAMQRLQGFVGTFGREVPVATVATPGTLDKGRQALARLLAAQPGLRVVVCSSDALAQGVVTEALERGLRVPQDLAVVGFGDAEFAAHMAPSLTTVRIDAAAIGREAARRVLARCRGERLDDPVADLGFHLVERRSTREDAPGGPRSA